MTASVGFCPHCGAARPTGAYICPQCNEVYPGTAAATTFRDGFGDWVWRGVAIGCGFMVLSVIVALVFYLAILVVAGGAVHFAL